MYHLKNVNVHVIQVIDENLNQFHVLDHVHHRDKNHPVLLMGKIKIPILSYKSTIFLDEVDLVDQVLMTVIIMQ